VASTAQGANVAVIGAGGYVFPLALIRDMLSFPALQTTDFRLYDISPERSERTRAAANELIARNGLRASASVSANRRDALSGADVVVCAFQIGGLDAYRSDVEIPREYGIDQTVGDTLGPGSVFRGLRTIAALRELTDDMRRHCPDALLLQYANPMSVNCWATDLLGVKTVGLCHSVQHTSTMLANELDVPYDEVTFDCAGVNHTAWFTTFRHGEKDLLDAIRETMSRRHLAPDAPGGKTGDVYQGKYERVRSELMELTGYFHTESSHHASEYWAWFRKSPEATAAYLGERWDYLDICSRHDEVGRIEEIIEGPLEPGNEYASYIVDSLVTGQPRVVYGNVINNGAIANLPDDACVEVACLADGNGVRPVGYGNLPAACAALNQIQTTSQRLVVQAGLSGDRRLTNVAIALDPLTSSLLTLPEIRELTDAMFAAEAEWLPQFGR
jgi:alpha-galactosidase